MWKGMIYKEWLKIRWFLLIYAGLGILAVVYIFIRVHHDITFSSPSSYWNNILFLGVQYFTLLKFIPVAGALAVAFAQFFPETISKRIKLTFHLPLNENKALLIMCLFGTGLLFISYTIQLLLFIGLSLNYFPSEILMPALGSVLPWYLAGFACYNFTALIVLEPVWKYRIFYLAIAVLFIPLLLMDTPTASFTPIIPYMAIIVLLSSFSLLFSAYRFRKGEM